MEEQHPRSKGLYKRLDKTIKDKNSKLNKYIKSTVKRSLYTLSEMKRHRALISTTVSTTSGLYHLSGSLIQGITDLGTRIGDKLVWNGLKCSGDISYGDANNIVRVILFFWSDSVTPVEADILDDTTSAITKMYGALQWDNQKAKRFRVISDRRYIVNNNNKQAVKYSFKRTFKRGVPVQFNAATTTILKNSIYLLLLSDSSAVAHPNMNLYANMYFTDF